ncbi:MAG: DNRLRE domain-containing protein [Deltaproteobacteria bacterium]|nr:MAG: DNRLRE domain-containing protein [Deltaproteobacteria bacterium]
MTGGAWSESVTAFASRPVIDGRVRATRGKVAPKQVVDFDVTGAVVDEDVYDFAVTSTSTDPVRYQSREGLAKPLLVVDLTQNTAPIVRVTAPASRTKIAPGAALTFAGTALDAQDGNLSARIRWVSSRDGMLGTGSSVTATLSEGMHTVTATVTDAGGLAGTATVVVRVGTTNAPPAVTITAPPPGSSVPAGTRVTLTATAADDFEGDVAGAVHWSSDRDGPLGAGATLSTVLSEGVHTLTAAATDSDGATGTAQVRFAVTPTAPVVTIAQPAPAARLFAGSPITFTASAIDATDGDVSAALTWTSDRDGPLGSGATITAVLSQGTRAVVAAAPDATGRIGKAQRTVIVRPPNGAPVVTILTPAAGGTALAAQPVLLSAAAMDPEDGDLGSAIQWTSDRDGVLGGGAAVSVATLSAGTHTLTATVRDREGVASSATVVLTIVPSTLHFAAVADTYVDAANPSARFGSAPALLAGAGPERQALLRFAVGGVAPFGVDRAVLRLTAGPGSGDGSKVGGTIRSLTSNVWSEAASTYATRPVVDGPVVATTGAVLPRQVVEFDVTSAVHGDGTVNLAVLSTSSDWVSYLSRESPAGAPELVVTLRQPTPQVTIWQPEAGRLLLNAAPIALVATAVDPTDGDVGASIVWTSDLDGPLGRGPSVTVTGLRPGVHTITAQANDRAGLIGVATVSLPVQVGMLTFFPIADTYVDQLFPLTPFGAANSIVAVGLPALKFALLRFAVAGIGTVPVADARLQLFVGSSRTASGGAAGAVRLISNNTWSEATTTYMNRPTISGALLDALSTPVVQGQRVDFRVGAAVTRDGTYNFALTSVSADAVKYQSRESGSPPRLVVTFRPLPSRLPQVTITAPATGTPVFDDDVVALAATAVDAHDGVLTRAVAWRSSLDGALGTGGALNVPHLSRGTHLLTASVKNRAGLVGTAAVTVTVTDRPPAVAVTAPANGRLFPVGFPITFTATAVDRTDGDVGFRLVWMSDRDGPLGSGQSITVPRLSPGDHRVTASVTNRLGTAGSASVSVSIGNAAPRLAISAPASGSTIAEGTLLTLVAAATDVEDGDLTSTITWTSDLQGPLGVGGNVPVVLSNAGTHHITATVTDSHGAMRAQEIDITITLAPPVLTVLSPADSSSVAGPVTLTAKAVDFRDGVRSAAIRWTSDVAGRLGTGPSVTVPRLAVGRHVITASITDSDGLTATQSVTIVAGNTPPTVTVLAPANGTTAPVWTPITFRGSATDAGDGDLGANLHWSSSLDGAIGTGATVTAARLSRGVHVVTAQAADSRGLTGTDSVVVVITGGPPTRAPDVSIVAPAPGAELALGAPVTFTAIAADDSGDLSARIVWVSDADGVLGVGREITTSGLSAGAHRVTASVVDPSGALGTASVSVTVVPPPLVFPAVADAWTDQLAPASNQGGGPTLELDGQPTRRIYLRFAVQGFPTTPVARTVVRLRTTAAAQAGGDLAGELRTVSGAWDELGVTHLNKPAMDGPLLASAGAVDPSANVDFDVTAVVAADGVYNFGLRTPSSNGVEYVAREGGTGGPALLVFPAPPARSRPRVQITVPVDGANVVAGTPVILAATATDPQDGDLGGALVWRSDRDGTLGTGPSITPRLSAGPHVITASAADSAGDTGSDAVPVFAGSALPRVTIVAPARGAAAPLGQPITFSGTAFDIPDGDLSSALQWTSSLDGPIGTGPTFSRALSGGTHTITASVTDKDGNTVRATTTFQVTTVRVGYEDFSYGPNIEIGLDKATATKAQSKLWYQDGTWWATLFVQAKSEYHIHRMDLATQSWIDTGVFVDERGKSRQDVLVDGQKLYMVSRYGFDNVAPVGNRLLRYTYYPSVQTYVLDAGFPVAVPGGGAEALTVAKDSLGRLWIAYALNGLVNVAHTISSDTDWSAPFQPPVPEGTTALPDDDAAVIALPGGRIGVFWSNQLTGKDYFAVHTDTAPDLAPTAWRLEIVSATSGVADDHFNLKLASDGRLFVAMKTGRTAPGETLVGLFVRAPTGVWAPLAKVTNTEFDPTRVLCLLDETNRRVYVLYSSFSSDIYYKSSSMDAIAFPPAGVGTPLMVSGTHPDPLLTGGINNPSSTKQNVDPSTGILVIASTSETDHYWHNWIYLPSPRPTVAIGAPADGLKVRPGEPVAFAATATSATEGVVSARLRWTSSRDGQIGTGAGFTTTGLSPGVHQITASVTDGSKLAGSATVTVTVEADRPPDVTILQPRPGQRLVSDQRITFAAKAVDSLEGDQGATLSWTSDVDGALGTGSSFSRTLTAGRHTITAAATDTGGLTAAASVMIDVVDPGPPLLARTAPDDGAVYAFGAPVTFAASASDPLEGDVTARLVWASSRDGALGTGGTLTRTTLSQGTHTVTATVTDGAGLSASTSFTVTVGTGS